MNTTEMDITEKCVEAAKNTEKIYQLGRESVLNPNLKHNLVDIKDNNWKYWGQKALEYEAWLKSMSDSLSVIIHGLFKEDDTKDVKDFGHMFANCPDLTIFPCVNTSNGEIFDYMYSGCRSMYESPELNTSKGKVFRHMYSGCKSLQKAPEHDTSNGEDFVAMYYGCDHMTELSNHNTSKGKNFQQFLDGCWRLKGSYEFDTSNGENFDYFARNCQQLTGLKINISNAITMKSPFTNCNALIYLEFEGDIPISLNLSNSPKLEIECVKNIIYSLKDYGADDNNRYKHTITLPYDIWMFMNTYNVTFGIPVGDGVNTVYVSVDEYLSHIGWLRA